MTQMNTDLKTKFGYVFLSLRIFIRIHLRHLRMNLFFSIPDHN